MCYMLHFIFKKCRHRSTIMNIDRSIFIDIEKLQALPRIKHPQWATAALFIGRLEKEKNPHLAIECIAQARAKGINAGLTIVGEGRRRAALEELVQQRGLTGRVVFTGFIRDITPLLATADILLVPSQYEGYGLVTVEALAARVPVLATDTGVAREAGAMIVEKKKFVKEFLLWTAGGPRQGALMHMPYRSEEEYVARYTADIAATRENSEE